MSKGAHKLSFTMKATLRAIALRGGKVRGNYLHTWVDADGVPILIPGRRPGDRHTIKTVTVFALARRGLLRRWQRRDKIGRAIFTITAEGRNLVEWVNTHG